MKKIRKSLSMLLVVALISAMNLTSVYAASSGNWSIRYYPSGAGSISNQNDTCTVTYYAGGFKAKNITISGTNGRWVELTTNDAGGMETIYITSTGSFTFKTRGASGGNVVFNLKARVGYSCESTGTISINI